MKIQSIGAFPIALWLVSVGAANAAPSFHTSLRHAVKAVQSASDDNLIPHTWTSPNAIQAGLLAKGVFLSAGDTYATYQGRKFESKETQIKAAVTDEFEIYYGRQFTLAKGRSATSRFHGDNSFFGGRYVFKRPNADDRTAWSLQYESIRPSSAEFNSGSSSETLAGTKNNLFAVDYVDPNQTTYQLGYSMIDAPGGLNARSINVAAGRDYDLGSNLLARIEANLVGQSFIGAGETSKFELKPIITGSLGYQASNWLSLEGNISAMPSGMPFSSGDFTGVSSFAVYTPGGIVNDLRGKFLAFGTLRLVGHWSF